jgi:hypothetical protein
MIEITKAESISIRKVYPDVSIYRTVRQKSKRHHYYLPEETCYLELIRDTNIEAREILKKMEKNNHY